MKPAVLTNAPRDQEKANLALAASVATALCGGSIKAFCSGVGLNGELSLDGAVQVPQVAAEGAVLGFAGTPRITTKSIKELTRVSGAYNIITVHVRTNFKIYSPASITISNLLGTKWPAKECVDNAINLRPTFMELLPNCSCSACEEDLACACDSSAILQNKENFFLWQPEGSNFFGTPQGFLQRSDVQGRWNPSAEDGSPDGGSLVLEFATGRDLVAGQQQQFLVG